MIVLLRSEATRYSILISTELAEDLPKVGFFLNRGSTAARSGILEAVSEWWRERTGEKLA